MRFPGPPPPSSPISAHRPRPRHERPDGRSRWSLRIATVAGIEIRVHVSFVALVALVALAATDPAGPGLAASLGWVVAVFACVVVHELAHSLVARSLGIGVHEIELLPIGGVSKLERIPDSPRDELKIAVVGPLASIVLGVGFAVAVIGAGGSVWPPSLVDGSFAARLAWFNLLVGGFNLLPALPMDGGRVLRALLERRSSPVTATARAARISRHIAVGMIVVGVLVNFWLLVIGVFVCSGLAGARPRRDARLGSDVRPVFSASGGGGRQGRRARRHRRHRADAPRRRVAGPATTFGWPQVTFCPGAAASWESTMCT